MTIRAAFDAYRMDVIAFSNQSRKTEESHLIVQRNLINFFGDLEIESLSFPMIRDWKLHLDKGRSPTTVRMYIIKLRIVLMYLRKQGYDVVDPDLIAIPKRRDRVPVYLTKENVAQLIECSARIKNKCIISFLYGSGLRISELCNLDRGSIRNKVFTVVGKGGKSRICFIDDRTQELLNQYLATREDNNEALFLTDLGCRLSPGTVQETFKSVRKRTGLNCHPHTLRHSFAVQKMEAGMHIYTLSRLLGHSSIATTQIYLHISDLKLQEEYERYHQI